MRTPALASALALAIVALLADTAGAGRWTRISLPMLSDLFCAAPCPEGFVARGLFVAKTTSKAASNRLAFKMRLGV